MRLVVVFVLVVVALVDIDVVVVVVDTKQPRAHKSSSNVILFRTLVHATRIKGPILAEKLVRSRAAERFKL